MACAGAVVSKPMAKKTILRSGRVRARFTASSWRVNDANVPAFGLDVEQIGFRAWYAKHVSVRYQRDLSATGQVDGAVDNFKRCNADGAARTVDKLNAIAEQLVDAITHEGVRLAATNLHEDPRSRGTPANFRG